MTDIVEINYPTFDKTLIWVNWSGIPYFFGIASFMFEGNALALEIYQQMDEAPKLFTLALGRALFFGTTLIVLLGSLSYAAYG
jgi:hypothetical protein